MSYTRVYTKFLKDLRDNRISPSCSAEGVLQEVLNKTITVDNACELGNYLQQWLYNYFASFSVLRLQEELLEYVAGVINYWEVVNHLIGGEITGYHDSLPEYQGYGTGETYHASLVLCNIEQYCNCDGDYVSDFRDNLSSFKDAITKDIKLIYPETPYNEEFVSKILDTIVNNIRFNELIRE